MRSAGLKRQSMLLGRINNQFDYQIEGDFAGLIVEEDVAERVLEIVDTCRT